MINIFSLRIKIAFWAWERTNDVHLNVRLLDIWFWTSNIISLHPEHREGSGDGYFVCQYFWSERLWGTHWQNVLQSRQSMFALRVLVAHGLHGQRLFDVVRAQRRHILLGTQAQCLLKIRFHKARSTACLPIYAYLLCYIYDYYVCKHFQSYVKFVRRAWNAFLLNVLFAISLARSASMLLTQVLRSLVLCISLAL